MSVPPAAADVSIVNPLDAALLGTLAAVVAESTAALDEMDYTTALDKAERFFWLFCDDPTPAECRTGNGDTWADMMTAASPAIAAIRKAKSAAKSSPRAETTRIVFTGPPSFLEQIRDLSDDLACIVPAKCDDPRAEVTPSVACAVPPAYWGRRVSALFVGLTSR